MPRPKPLDDQAVVLLMDDIEDEERAEYFLPSDTYERFHCVIIGLEGDAKAYREGDGERYIRTTAHNLAVLTEDLLVRYKDDWRKLTGRAWSRDEAHDTSLCFCARDLDDEEATD